MHDPTRDQALSHAETAELLPWLVNGSLADDDLHRVEAHLERCADCRREAARLERMARALAGRAEPVAPPRPDFAAVMAHIEAAESPGDGASGRRARPASGRSFAWLLAAQAAAVALLSVVLLWPSAPGDDGAGFRTLARPAAAPALASAPRLRVVFEEQLTEVELRDLLLSVRGRVVAGPTPFGVYTVELASIDSGELAGVVDRLRRSGKVRFVETVVGQ